LGDVLLIQLSKDEASSRTVLDPKEIDTSYWRYLQGISYHHFKGYLKSLKAEEHFDELYPLILKKLQACAAMNIFEED
tara:strand:+ start:1150 stop:1383 length:234 start_codon:yes stop_codon:yes gene_type:complete